jgi:CPA1 family monovalent cation:H+ antiporter
MTVLAVGYFAHWLIPELPLPIAFALAAVLSPTDAVRCPASPARAASRRS